MKIGDRFIYCLDDLSWGMEIWEITEIDDDSFKSKCIEILHPSLRYKYTIGEEVILVKDDLCYCHFDINKFLAKLL